MTSSTQETWINGFMVVRKAAFNKDAAGRGSFPMTAPCLADLCYGGIDRMAWFDVDDQFYAGTLPDSILQVQQRIYKSNSELSGIEICRELDLALMLLEYSNGIYNANELIAIRSEALTPFKGIVTIDPARLEWIGYDVVALGQQSLLSDGLFSVPAAFPNWQTRINRFGLLSSRDLVASYIDAYRQAARTEQVEDFEDIAQELAPLGYTVAAIQIAQVRPTNGS